MSKRQELRNKRRQQENVQRIGVVVVMALIAAAIVGWIYLAQRPLEGIVQLTPTPRPQVNFSSTGDPNAPIKIIEYADFQCPFCRQFWHDTEAQLVAAYVKTGKVYLEYHSVGLFIGPESVRAAEAAYCAGDQGKFWEMHDTIFANQGTTENSGALDDAHLTVFAKNVGLDMTQFNDCFGSGKYASRVTQDGADAAKNIPAAPNYPQLVADQKYAASGISTPTFLLNGKLLAGGALTFSEFQTEIEAALAAAGKK